MKTNKLDEILEAYRSNLDNDITDKDFILSKKFAKQAIIELIEGEIIGENMRYLRVSEVTISNIINDFKEEQRQKLQKLKE